jgi:Rrf2 family protein
MAGKGLVASLRGARGGYRLARKLDCIPVSDVIEAIDGPIALTACVDGGDCESGCLCPMRGRWDPVNQAIRAALTAISLADMAGAVMPPAFRLPLAEPRRTLADAAPHELPAA